MHRIYDKQATSKQLLECSLYARLYLSNTQIFVCFEHLHIMIMKTVASISMIEVGHNDNSL